MSLKKKRKRKRKETQNPKPKTQTQTQSRGPLLSLKPSPNRPNPSPSHSLPGLAQQLKPVDLLSFPPARGPFSLSLGLPTPRSARPNSSLRPTQPTPQSRALALHHALPGPLVSPVRPAQPGLTQQDPALPSSSLCQRGSTFQLHESHPRSAPTPAPRTRSVPDRPAPHVGALPSNATRVTRPLRLADASAHQPADAGRAHPASPDPPASLHPHAQRSLSHAWPSPHRLPQPASRD